MAEGRGAPSPGADVTWIDSHCHLTDARFDDDRERVLERARAGGVAEVVTVASDVADAREVATLTRTLPDVYGTAGAAEDGDLKAIRDLMASEARIVAVGETGLDFHYDNSPRDVQIAWFRRHVELAGELGAPVVVHSREADARTAEVIREVGTDVTGVLHCFTAGMELLETGLDAGWYVSFSGIASFKSFGAEDAVRAVPADRLLVETDAPYLAPVPERGKRNEPAFVRHVGEAVARILDEEPEAVARRTTANARRFYGIEDGPRGGGRGPGGPGGA